MNRATSVLRRSARSSRRGFTLVEIIVVIGVIVLLVGLVVAVIPVVTGQSQQRETQNVLRLLDLAYQDWEQAREKRLSIGPGPIFDINTNQVPSPDDWAAVAIALMMRAPESAEILRQIDPDLLTRDPDLDRYEIADAWGEAIVLLYPGLPWEAVGGVRDPDGTVRTEIENRLGVAVNRKVAFVSAGPDARLGDLHLDLALDALNETQQAEATTAADNLASYLLGTERPR